MDFDNARIDQLVGRMATLLPAKLTNEEATKASLVTPFIAALGYDVHDPNEVMREFGADAGRGGEAVDYAIVERGKPIIMIEAKHHEVTLKEQQERQLRRYFNATPECRVGILTNGLTYKAFSDIHAQNVMDEPPVLRVGHAVPQPRRPASRCVTSRSTSSRWRPLPRPPRRPTTAPCSTRCCAPR